VLTGLALPRVAAVADVQIAGEVEAPIPAARRLAEVPPDRSHRPELGRRGERARLSESVRDLRVDLKLGKRRAGSDRRAVDSSRQDSADVDERLRAEEPVAEERDDLGPAGAR